MNSGEDKPSAAGDADRGRQVIEAEIRALQGLVRRLDPDVFNRAVEALFACRGRVIVSGIGKAGIIGEKISATLASTGTPSHSVHPIEAVHGDLGRILADDIVLILSNSGETEVVQLLPYVRQIGARIIAITSERTSTLARHSDVVLDIGPIEEACPLGLAPSASTTAMLAMGDALALCVAMRRNFNKEDYALYHPGGELGRKLMRVEQIMRTGEECCYVHAMTPVREALRRISATKGRAGAVTVVDDGERVVGIFTDGDLRRRLQRDAAFLDGPMRAVMTATPKTVTIGSFATEAARIMREARIDELPVVDGEGRFRGILDIQDLLATRLIQ